LIRHMTCKKRRRRRIKKRRNRRNNDAVCNMDERKL